MKCPKKECDGEMVGEIVESRVCAVCGLEEDSQTFEDAVNIFLDKIAEEGKDAEVG